MIIRSSTRHCGGFLINHLLALHRRQAGCPPARFLFVFLVFFFESNCIRSRYCSTFGPKSFYLLMLYKSNQESGFTPTDGTVSQRSKKML